MKKEGLSKEVQALLKEVDVNLNLKDINLVVEAVFEAVATGMNEDGKVYVRGFGTFEVRERSARKGRNPQTGEEIDIPAKKAPAFKPAKTLKDSIQ